jgi:hypothetical protein
VRLIACAILCSLAAPAFADKPLEQPVGTSTGVRFGERPPVSYKSPQWFALEIKFGSYVPSIDASPGLRAFPFGELFVDPSNPEKPAGQLLTQLEFDVQFFKKFGTLGVGFAIGLYRNTAKSFAYADTAGTKPCMGGQCVRTDDETALNVVPLELLLVYRLDYFLQRWHVPLVPYFKFGIAYYIWAIQNGSGGIATYTDAAGNTSDGQGGTWGITLHPGLSLALDSIDPSAGRVMDAELGINHVHVFVEMNYANISNFGRDRTLVLSDLSYALGIAFEF